MLTGSRQIRCLFVLFMSVMLITVPLTEATAQSVKALSPSGGIGNTRADFRKEWGPLRVVGEAWIYERQEYVTYDTPDYNVQLSVMYLLDSDGKTRDTDRVGWFMISLMDSITLSQAKRIVSDYLPLDARLDRSMKNRFNEPREVYESSNTLSMFPSLNIDGETIQGRGEIWVTYGTMGGSSVVAIEMGLYDDYAE